MANRKLTELPSLSSIPFDSTDLLYIVDVETDVSKSVPFNLLVGGNLVTLSAYNTQNTLNVSYLSGEIEDNTGAIAILDSGGVSLAADTQYLSGQILVNRSDVLTISAELIANNPSEIVTDVLTISGNLDTLSATVVEIENTGGEIVDIEADVVFLSGSIGTITALATTSTNLVGAVNEVRGSVGNSYPAADAIKVGFITITQAVDLDNLETKVGFISITQAVDLDTLETTANNAIPLATLQTETAASTDFADFQSRIAAL